MAACGAWLSVGRIVISHLGPAQETEIRFLLDSCEALRARGHQPILWSGIYDRRFAPYYLPLNWRLKELDKYYADLSTRALPGVDLEKWRARVAVLIKQDWKGPSEELFERLVSMTAQVMDTLKPDMVLAWNSLCPHTGMAFDYNRACGRSAWMIEKAVFPETWFIEAGGLVGHSVLAGTPLSAHVPEERMEEYAQRGRDYLARSNFGAYNRYAQSERCDAFERATSGPHAELRPRIAFFPPDDGTLGFVPADHDDRRKTIPHYENSFAAAKALSQAHGGITLYKVHPSLAEHPHDTTGYPNLHVVNYDFRKVIEWADIVATTGSGLEFIAMAMGKPVLLLGNDILAGKGIAYEGQDPQALPSAIAAAHAREDFAKRSRRFEAYCGWLATEFLISTTAAPMPRRAADEIADELCTQLLGNPGDPDLPEQEFWSARAGLLTAPWRDKLARETAEVTAMRGGERRDLMTEPSEILAAMAACESDLILDFDNTLILQNSTERWLDTLRPKTLAFLVCLVCDFVVGFAARRRWCKAERWRDQLRVAATTLLFPWNIVWWRLSAKRRMARYLNNDIAQSVASAQPREITVVTFGFRHIVAPLLAQLPFKVTLIASEALSTRYNLRKRGKVDALMTVLGPERVRTALFVTDSRDDQEVIDHAGQSALHQWAPYPSPAFARTYFPMRYAVQGKYAGRNYFKTQILQEDLAIWLLAYPWSVASLPVLVLLFTSMYCIYEIGYWENDHVAARSEAKPTLSKNVDKFSQYPIRQAWPWAVALAIAATFYEPFVLLRPVGSPGHLQGIIIQWLLVLLTLRTAFWAFNRLRVTLRPYVFPILHFIKNFAPALLIPISPLAWLLLASQFVSQMMVYIAHRSGGNSAAFNRQAQRMIIFGALALAMWWSIPIDASTPGMRTWPFELHAWAGQLLAEPWHTPVVAGSFAIQLGCIAVWLAFRTLQRAYGRGIVSIMGRVLRSRR